MLRIVIVKPIQFTIVKEVPRDTAGAFCATIVENKGESATTSIPQQTRKLSNTIEDPAAKTNGESRQQQPERARAPAAILRAPNRCDNIPPSTQATPPEAMMVKLHRETCNPGPAKLVL